MRDLDEQSDSVSGKGATFRERGCVLRVVVSYDNTRKTWMGTRYVWCVVCVRTVHICNRGSNQGIIVSFVVNTLTSSIM